MTEVTSLGALLAFLILSFMVLCGWGIILKRLLGVPVTHVVDISDFWLGHFVSLFAYELLNLWLPVDWRVSVTFFGIGLGYFLKHRVFDALNWLLLYKPVTWTQSVLWIACGSMVIFASFWAMALPINEDSWSYHFQSIRWANEYPIVPGLGNLHGRLAFNQSHFGFLALLNFFPYWNKGYAAGGLVLWLATAFTCLSLLARYLHHKKALLLLLLVVIEPLAKYSSSPSPDFAVSLLQVVGIIYLVNIVHGNSKSPFQKYADLCTVLLVCAALCSVKLSGLIYGAALSGVAVWCARGILGQYRRGIMSLLIVIVIFIVVHGIRGIITSGVPLYPSTVGSSFSFDWSVPLERIQNEAAWIYSCARTGSPCQAPALVMRDWNWLGPWWANLVPTHSKLLLGCSLTAMCAASFADFLAKNSFPGPRHQDWLLMIPFVAALVFWFLSAPDVRFLGTMLELMFGLSFWALLCSWDRHLKLSQTFAGGRLVLARKFFQSWNFPTIASVTILIFCTRLLPVPAWSWPSLPQPATRVIAIKNGFSVFEPAGGTCWFMQLPCSPAVDPYLEYRETQMGDPLAHGFRVRGKPE